jgi:hypothetical protein
MIAIWQLFSSRVRPGLFLTLLFTLISAYFVTYSAFFESQDTTRIYDAASSLARYGDLGRDETLWRDPPNAFGYSPDYPIASFDPDEAAMPITVSLWFRVVDAIPGIGLVHGTWLFNIFVVAVTCGLFFQYARLLQYSDSVALSGALLLGLTTALWVYSKTLFREPLVALLLLITAFALEGWRRVGYLRGIAWTVLAVLFIIVMTFTKNSGLVALPALFALLIPEAVFNYPVFFLKPHQSESLKKTDQSRLSIRKLTLGHICDGLLIALVLLIIAITFSDKAYNLFSEILLQISGRFRGGLAYGQEALFTYLFSIGGSIWGTSPVILLGVVGCGMLIRQGKRRLVWCIVLLLTGYALSHALLTGQHWFGGVSFPPRFLIPILPLMMLAVLPVMAWLLQKGRSIFWRILAVLWIGYSFIVQIIGGVSLLLAYSSFLPLQSNSLYEWSGGLTDIRYLRWVLLPRSWSSVGFDTAWSRLDMPIFAVIYAVLAIMGLLLLWQWKMKRLRLLLPIIIISLLLTTSIELRLLYQHDRQYEANNQALFDVLSLLDTNAVDGEPLLLEANADVTHERFIMNYSRVDNVRPIVLGFPPAESASETDRGCVPDWVVYERERVCLEMDYPPAMLDGYAVEAIDYLAERHERIWFLAHNSEFFAWSVRPIERYLNERFYRIHEYRTDNPGVRLLLYSTVNAPSRYDFRLPEHTTNLSYENMIRLSGFTLPSGTVYRAGDIVQIMLWWQPLSPIGADYVVAWFIVSRESGQPVAQGMDSMPDAGFAPTSQWQVGELVYDNRAIQLPVDIAVGEYHIWILLYPAASGGTERLSVTGDETIEDEIGVLPITLTVAP